MEDEDARIDGSSESFGLEGLCSERGNSEKGIGTIGPEVSWYPLYSVTVNFPIIFNQIEC